jgi:hypothetical protein
LNLDLNSLHSLSNQVLFLLFFGLKVEFDLAGLLFILIMEAAGVRISVS